GPHQQVVLRPQKGGDLAQEATAAAGREVPDRAAQEGHYARTHRLGDAVEVALEVADHAVDVQAGVLLDQLRGAVTHHRLRHVYRDVADERAGLVQRIEQHARLGGRAGAQLDELGGVGQLRELLGAPGEDRPLGARRVVLGQI